MNIEITPKSEWECSLASELDNHNHDSIQQQLNSALDALLDSDIQFQNLNNQSHSTIITQKGVSGSPFLSHPAHTSTADVLDPKSSNRDKEKKSKQENEPISSTSAKTKTKSFLHAILNKLKPQDRTNPFPLLKQIPKHWTIEDPTPLLTLYHKPGMDYRYEHMIKSALFAIPACAISFSKNSLGDYPMFVTLIYSILCSVAPVGNASIGIALFIFFIFLIVFSATSLLSLCALVGGTGGQVLTILVYVVLLLFLSPLKIEIGTPNTFGNIKFIIVIIGITAVFWDVYPFLRDGIQASVSKENLEQFIWNSEIPQYLQQIVAFLTDIFGLNFLEWLKSLEEQIRNLFNSDPPVLVAQFVSPQGFPMAGHTIDLYAGTTGIDLIIEPGTWMIRQFLWSGGAGTTGAWNVALQTLVGCAIFAIMFWFPPKYTFRDQLKTILATLVATLMDTLRCFFGDPSHDEKVSGGSLDLPVSQDWAQENIHHLRAQIMAMQAQLKNVQTLSSYLPISMNLFYPHVFTDFEKFYPQIISQLSSLINTFFWFGVDATVSDDQGSVLLHSHTVFAPQQFAHLQQQTLALLDICGKALVFTPCPFKKSKMIATDLINQLENQQEQVLLAFSDYKNALPDALRQKNQTTSNQVFKHRNLELLLAESWSKKALFYTFPLTLSDHVCNMLKSQYKFNLIQGFKNVLIGIVGLTLAVIPPSMKNISTFFRYWIQYPPSFRKLFMNRDIQGVIQITLSLLLLFILPMFSDTYRTWVWPKKNGITEPIVEVGKSPNKMDLWSVLAFAVIWFRTAEGTFAKAYSRILGQILGCLLAWAAVASTSNNVYGIIAWFTVVSSILTFLSMDEIDPTFFYSDPSSGYFFRSALIGYVVILLEFYPARDSYTIEYYVLSRIAGHMLGGLLAIFVSWVVFANGAGFIIRDLLIQSFEHTIVGSTKLSQSIKNWPNHGTDEVERSFTQAESALTKAKLIYKDGTNVQLNKLLFVEPQLGPMIMIFDYVQYLEQRTLEAVKLLYQETPGLKKEQVPMKVDGKKRVALLVEKFMKKGQHQQQEDEVAHEEGNDPHEDEVRMANQLLDDKTWLAITNILDIESSCPQLLERLEKISLAVRGVIMSRSYLDAEDLPILSQVFSDAEQIDLDRQACKMMVASVSHTALDIATAGASDIPSALPEWSYTSSMHRATKQQLASTLMEELEKNNVSVESLVSEMTYGSRLHHTYSFYFAIAYLSFLARFVTELIEQRLKEEKTENKPFLHKLMLQNYRSRKFCRELNEAKSK